ncbi:MAG TPA: MFS transporter [Miltoncostaeaceae bacterium]|nr:MFS transporter [Miltoncostaeaceae bacterium]
MTEPRATLEGRALVAATAALLLGVFAVGSEALVISPLLEDIAGDFGTGVDAAGLSVSVYGLAVAVVAPTAGWVADRVSRRGAILWGLVVFAVAGALCAAAPSLLSLVAGRALCGVGAGLFLPAAYAWVGDEVPYESRARVMGWVIAGWALALVAGVPAGGLIGEVAGWREALAALAALAAAATVLAAHLLPVGSGAARSDVGGARVGLRRALAVPAVRWLLAVNLLDMLAFYGVYTYLGSFLRDELDVRSGVAGALILAYGAGVALMSMNGGLIDRVGKARTATLTLAALTVIYAGLPWVAGALILLVLVLAVMGTQQAGFLTAMATLATNAMPEGRGAVVALMSCTTYIGVTLGAAAMGPVFSGPGYEAIGGVCAAIAAVAAVLSLRLRAGDVPASLAAAPAVPGPGTPPPGRR